MNYIILVGILITLGLVGITDYKKHIIPNSYMVLLFLFGSLKLYFQYSCMDLVIRCLQLVLIFCICIAIGYYYLKNKNIDIAGGGDFKLIAILGFLFGLQGLFICLLFELIFEILYRYILFPHKKTQALPIGASLSLFGIILLLGGIA